MPPPPLGGAGIGPSSLRRRAGRAPRERPSRSRSADYGAPDPAGKGQFQTSGGAGSFADDLCKERGIVRSRVDVFPRSSEIKPLFRGSVRFFFLFIYLFFFSFFFFFFFYFFSPLFIEEPWVLLGLVHFPFFFSFPLLYGGTVGPPWTCAFFFPFPFVI